MYARQLRHLIQGNPRTSREQRREAEMERLVSGWWALLEASIDQPTMNERTTDRRTAPLNPSHRHPLNRLYSRSSLAPLVRRGLPISRKVNGKWIYYSAFICRLTFKALWYGSHSFTYKLHHTCHYLVSVHQMAPPVTDVTNIYFAAYYSFIDPERMKGWVGMVGWPIADGYPHKWSPVSCRSSAGHGKFAGQRPAFYRCATRRRNQPRRVL